MRKNLNAVSVLALLFNWVITLFALYSSHPLPPRIAVHFDAAGHANGWGSPRMLWILPIVASAMYALIAWVTRHPNAFNYPVYVTPANRPRLQVLALAMIAWIQAEVVCLFAWIQWITIESARRGVGQLPPWTILIAIFAVWITIGWYVVAMLRAGRR